MNRCVFGVAWLTCGDSDWERTVVDLLSSEEDVDRVKSRDERRVLDVPQIR